MVFSLLPYSVSVFLSGNIFERKEEGTYRGNAKGKFKNLSHRSKWDGRMSSQSA